MMLSNFQSIEKYYDLKVKSITNLHGYANQNYLLDTQDNKRFILKRYKDLDTKSVKYIEFENIALQNLYSELPEMFPIAISTKQGQFIVQEKEGKHMRLLSYLKGNFFDRVEQTPALYASLGEFLAKMNLSLSRLTLLGLEAKVINWDLQHFLKNEPYLNSVHDVQIKKLIKYFIVAYRQEVQPYHYQLRKSIIHSDANEQNILVKGGQVSGMIDFGDFCYSYLINELAIALTYAMQNKQEPIKWALYIVKSYHQILPLQKLEIVLLYWLIAARICTSLLNSATSRAKQPENEYVSASEEGMIMLLQKWITISPDYATKEFLKVVGMDKGNNCANGAAEMSRRNKYFSKAYSLSYSSPIKMKRAAFQYMFDTDGNTFLDAYNNIPLVGHCHPAITEAAQKQISTLNTNTRYFYDALHQYAENLLATFPPQLNKVFFVNSGSAASDLAIRLATNYTSSNRLAVMEHGYHGNTQIGIDISAYKAEGKGGNGLPKNILKLPMPDVFKGKFQGEDAGKAYAQEAIKVLSSLDVLPAAFIVEPIIGCGGQVPLPSSYLLTLYQFLKTKGIICISDEVQVGMGRLGDVFWGFEQHHVIPDIVVVGKPVGNGHPIGAVICTAEIAESFENGMEFFSSFGGNPVSCIIGDTVLKVLKEEGLQQKAFETGEFLKFGFEKLAKEYSQIGDVRGSGLFLGAEILDKEGNRSIDAGKYASSIKNYLRENYILSSTDGPYDSVLKFKPPLCFNQTNAEQLLDQFEQGLKNLR